MFDKKPKFSLAIDAATDAGEELFLNAAKADADWHEEEEGQLSLDIAQTADELFVVATMSGTEPDKIELHLHGDLLTIRGYREAPFSGNAEFLVNESYWGRFSRTVVLPVNVKAELARAQYKFGVLTIILPKAAADKNIPIYVVEE